MRQRSSATFNFACAFAVMSTAALAYGIASRPAARERAPEVAARPAAGESVVARSQGERNAAAIKLRLAEESAAADRALFIPAPTYAITAPVRAATVAAAAPVVAAAPPPPSRPAPQVRLASVAAKPAVPTRSLTRPGAVLNDAQIANIKRRLNLTPDQERMWPSVEVALRNLSYSKKGGHDAAQAVASIDPASAEVQNLKSAAMPLVMSFSGDQMRELQSISRVAGLDKLVPNF
jgi:hypothetical protein